MNAPSEPVTSLLLAQGNYPFALSDDERRMTGDEWAWRFLRLNPCYRRDYELLQKRPALLKELRRHNPSRWKEGATFEQVKQLDVRYFSRNASILDPSCKWPNLDPLTLGTFLAFRPEIELHHLALRDFDSARLYGISDWFDPSLPTLPELKQEQSWFFNLTEPIFSVGDNLFIGRQSSWVRSPRGNQIAVGYEGDAKRRKSHHIYGEIRKTNDRGEVLVSFGRLDDQPPQRILEKYNERGELIESLDVKYEAPLKSDGFAHRSEMVFAVNLDGYIQPQLRANRDLAQHFQNLLIEKDSLRIQPCEPICHEPLIFRPDRAVATPFAHIQTDLANLAREPASAWQNWYIALIDVSYPLSTQFEIVQQLLRKQQQRLQEVGALAHSLRERAGRTKGNFWLKQALCFLELQLNLLPERKNTPLGADRIARAIYNTNDTQHERVWGATGWAQAPRAGVRATETFKEALRLGKDLAESQYAFLIGAAAADIARAS